MTKRDCDSQAQIQSELVMKTRNLNERKALTRQSSVASEKTRQISPRAEAHVRALYNKAAQAIASTDDDGKFIEVNPTFRKHVRLHESRGPKTHASRYNGPGIQTGLQRKGPGALSQRNRVIPVGEDVCSEGWVFFLGRRLCGRGPYT